HPPRTRTPPGRRSPPLRARTRHPRLLQGHRPVTPQHHKQPMYRDERDGLDMSRWLCQTPGCPAVISQSTLDLLDDYNHNRQAAAGYANPARAREALAILGDRCPEHWYRAARLRIDNPQASWTELARTEGCTRNVLAGNFRRLLNAAYLR